MLSMPLTMSSLFIFMFIMGMLKFMSNWSHILSTLISLEFMALSLFFMFAMGSEFNEMYISLFYLAIAVCEGALGLSILVLFTRDKGDDMLSTKNLPMW